MESRTMVKPAGGTSVDLAVNRLRARLKINLQTLHEECAEQALLFEEASQLTTEAKVALAHAQLERDKTKANTELDIRANPDNYGLTKVTEGSVSAALTSSPVVVACEETIIKQDEQYRTVLALVGALEQRRSMLNSAVSLYVHSYFMFGGEQGESGDNGPKRLSDEDRQRLINRISSISSEESTDE